MAASARKLFTKQPFSFTKQLFRETTSGTRSVEREELEAHFMSTYSDANREVPVEIVPIRASWKI